MSPNPAQPDPKRWLALLFISIAQLMVFLDGAIMNIALPSAQESLHFSDGNRQWVITVYGLAFGGLLVLGGRLADLWGRRRIFIIGLIGFALASGIGGVAANLPMLLTARALQGVFGALLAPAALALISVAFTDSRERAKAFGIYGALATAGGAIGLLLGGVLTEYATWRWGLLINLPIAAIGIAGVLAVVRDTGREAKRARLDVPGAILATAGAVALVFGFARAENDGWASAVPIGMFLASAVLLAAFVLLESRVKSPLLPLRVLKDRNRAGAYLSMGLSVMSMFGMFLFLSYYFQLVKDYSPVQSGAAFIPMAIAQAVGSTQIAARLSRFVRPGRLMGTGFAVSGVGVLMLAALDPGSSFVYVSAAEVVMGLGIGTAFMPAFGLASHGVDAFDVGVASAMINTSQQVGGSVGTALLNTVAASATASFTASRTGSAGLVNRALVHGFSVAYVWATGFLIAAAVVAFVAITAGRPETAAADPAGTLDERVKDGDHDDRLPSMSR
ncbi:DHA2 family efflux MFS transporter permease subunit [Streptomyces sp. NPDC050804]|uniref:DHA2 family efflux MFS transporter permease subunit n=1 Tax=Streptomyces sp. NPDC050804 TaxID=3154745 RepID=UPI00342DEA29